MTDAEFLAAVRHYIETTEETIDGEFGMCRKLAELIADGEMPPLYSEVLRRLSALQQTLARTPAPQVAQHDCRSDQQDRRHQQQVEGEAE